MGLADVNPSKRHWADLTVEEQLRVIHLLTIDSDDNLADIEARCERVLQIIRGEKP